MIKSNDMYSVGDYVGSHDSKDKRKGLVYCVLTRGQWEVRQSPALGYTDFNVIW